MNMSHWKTRSKLVAGFGIIVVLLLMLAVLSFTQLRTITSVNASQENVRKQQLEPLFVAREALGQTGLAARNVYVFKNESDAKWELDILDRQKAIYLDALAALAPVLRSNPEFEKVRQGLTAMAEELKRPRQYLDAKKSMSLAHSWSMNAVLCAVRSWPTWISLSHPFKRTSISKAGKWPVPWTARDY